MVWYVIVSLLPFTLNFGSLQVLCHQGMMELIWVALSTSNSIQIDANDSVFLRHSKQNSLKRCGSLQVLRHQGMMELMWAALGSNNIHRCGH